MIRPARIGFGVAVLLGLLLIVVSMLPLQSYAIQNNRLIDDPIFDNADSMSAASIDTFLNSFPGSCISTNSGFSAVDPTGYNPTNGFLYGGNVSAGKVIYDAAQAYGINPQVLLATVQKEQSLVSGSAGCNTNNISKALGYGCPDGGSSYSYNDVNLFTRNGTTYTSVSGICVNSAAKAGFSQQIIHAAWMLKFSEERSEGNIGWAIIKGNWDNSDDLSSTYSGYMTQGCFKRSKYESTCTYYDGWTTIDNTSVHIDTGATAALYRYTPHFSGNTNFVNIFSGWFGSTTSSPLITSVVTTDKTTYGTGEGVQVSYSVQNPSNDTIVVPSIGISNRLSDGSVYDFNIQSNLSFAPQEKKTFSGVFYPGKSGVYTMAVSYNLYNSWWVNSPSTITVKKPTLSLTSPVAINPEFPLVSNSHTVTFTLKNTGSVTACLTYVMAANTSAGSNFGYTAASPVILSPGQAYTYTASRTAASTAAQVTWASYMLPTGEWFSLGNTTSWRSYATPASVQVAKQPFLNPSDPLTNKSFSYSFTLSNSGDQPIRYSQIGGSITAQSDSKVYNLPQKATLLLGNQSYTYTGSLTVPTVGQYSSTAHATPSTGSGNSFDSTGPSPNLSAPDFTVYSTPTDIVDSTPLTNMTIKQGQLASLSYVAKNLGDQPANNMQQAFYCRFQELIYCDIPGDSITLGYNQTHTLSRNVSFTTAGQYWLQPLKYLNGVWSNFGTRITMNVQPYTPKVDAKLTLSSNSLNLGQTVTSTLTLTNNDSVPLQIPRYAVAARNNGFFDYGLHDWFIINPGETKTFIDGFTPPEKGTFTMAPTMGFGNTWYTYNWQKLTVN